MNILFVCTGNTCRSPMAAVLINKIAIDRNLDVRIESAGIYAADGDSASTQAIEVMKEYGIDLSEHRSKRISEDLIAASSLILTMTLGQKMYFGGNPKVFTLSEYAGFDYEIADPFGGSVEDYRKTAQQIYKAVISVADRIEKESV